MLDAIIELIARIDVVLYFLCGLGFLLGLRTLHLSSQMKRVALFPLEKEAARNLRRRGMSTIGSMIALAGSVYIVGNVVRPMLASMPVVVRSGVPTVDSQQAEVPTPEMSTTPRPLLFPTVTPTFGILAPVGEETSLAEVAPTSKPDGSVGCELIGVTITNPIPGETVAGQVQVLGEANILNFAAYKFEISGPSTEGIWATMGTFTTPVASGFLGTWDSTSLEAGDYLFRLVVLDVEGNFPQPCEIPITIASRSVQPVGTETPGAP